MVSCRPVHIRALSASPEISAADNNAYFHACGVKRFYLFDQIGNAVVAKTETGFARQCFPADFY